MRSRASAAPTSAVQGPLASGLWALIAAILALVPGNPACAHPVVATSAIVKVGRDGKIEIAVAHDALAFALNDLPARVTDEEMYALMDGPREDLAGALAAARERFEKAMDLSVNGARVALRVTASPTAEQVGEWKASGVRPLLPVKLEFEARGEAGAEGGGEFKVAARFPEMMGDVVLTFQAPGKEPVIALVRGGERSDEYTARLPGGAPGASGGGDLRPGAVKGALRFVGMGFEHIVDVKWGKGVVEWILGRGARPAKWPEGLDHVLFVLGLFFLSAKWRPLLIQITTFTVAHSVTLALAARGTVHLSASIVEPAIAASIALVAAENLFTQKVHAWRPLVVFGFGLIHGLGFASAFADAVGTDKSPLGPVLLFNVGVELGQLTIVGIALLAVGWFADRPWYRARIAIPASVCIALMGVIWTVQRIWF